ncbi:Uncharacterised protein [Mycobacteroides abscessus]|uniref:Uncharacterized protein n=5 Tax=Mycobacteroides TaxID=670516 RepID=A0AB74FES5_9MYCO|nr:MULTISPECIES: hypothetical protein [Mycobacteroides]MDM2386814.1 hypothetical protein [Mycobacteroides abscessus]WKE42444.1 hypothetical protein P3M63_15025 [Mycobacteroides abscessus subsp. massiliense]CPR39999.1 Uncharacterised protein [Mycobacteroides abscessus]CPS65595.1 Uncharacterised protein [Mycobacteroides abscessus]CPT25264.1 Uncharacterised protein [Mycobacteroides abscessus]
MTVPDGSQETMRAKARVCAVIDKLRQLFGRTFEVLCDQEAFTALMIGAGLAIQSCETRINPNGTTTELTTLTVPNLVAVTCERESMVLSFKMTMGSSITNWLDAEATLRSGLRASSLAISEPVGGFIEIEITVAEGS